MVTMVSLLSVVVDVSIADIVSIWAVAAEIASARRNDRGAIMAGNTSNRFQVKAAWVLLLLLLLLADAGSAVG